MMTDKLLDLPRIPFVVLGYNDGNIKAVDRDAFLSIYDQSKITLPYVVLYSDTIAVPVYDNNLSTWTSRDGASIACPDTKIEFIKLSRYYFHEYGDVIYIIIKAGYNSNLHRWGIDASCLQRTVDIGRVTYRERLCYKCGGVSRLPQPISSFNAGGIKITTERDPAAYCTCKEVF